jgi:hypothetical protein
VGDLAEYFEMDKDYAEPGHIVSLVPGSEDIYKLSENSYDPYIVGVISENPSVVLNNPQVGPPVGLAGRVKVKLLPDQSLIKSGDFITTSTSPGLGQKARKTGTIIGYAVRNQKPGEDYVEILLQPGRLHVPAIIDKNKRSSIVTEINGVPVKGVKRK